MRNSAAIILLAAGSLAAGVLPRIEFPADSPVAFLKADYGESNESARGGAVILDLHTALSLRNSSQRRIRGITLIVTAQDMTPGGKGSITVTSLDVAPGESFPVRIDLRLLRPLQAGTIPVVVGLDGVLFEDLAFYGPDKLNSRRVMTLCEWEARRDRQYFKTLLAEGGPERLRQEVLASQARAADRPNLNVQMVRAGRTTNYEPEKQVQFAFLKLPDSPIEPLEGHGLIAGNEARLPKLDVRNRSDRAIRYMEIGWIVQDRQGHEYLAGALPAPLTLAPGQKMQVQTDTALRFPRPANIDSMSGYVSNVEFADGSLWIPNRSDLADPRLQKLVAPSAEEQRLVQIYNKRGLKGLVDEVKKF